MGCQRSAVVMLSVSPALMAAAMADERVSPHNAPVAISGKRSLGSPAIEGARLMASSALDRVTFAIDGAESSHGADLGMWRPDPSGPQGPMQVSEAAATDVGGGDRFDFRENRAIGRAYLAQLYWRYKNWPDAIAAYNWGIGNMDSWVKAGRPAEKLVIGVAAYLRRVLRDSSLCEGSAAPPVRATWATAVSASPHAREAVTEGDACTDLDTPNWALDAGDRRLFAIPHNRFYDKLDRAMRLALSHVPAAPQSAFGRGAGLAVSWNPALGRP